MNGIRYYRNKFDLTQTGLALKIGVSLDTVSRWETGKREPRSSELRKMAILFGCTIDDLINPTPPSPRKPKGARATRKAVKETAEAVNT
jgi:DNA-binding XRE family transcriptional regulator